MWFVLVAFSLRLFLVHGAANHEFEHHLSTKTPYRIVESTDVAEVQFVGCVPKKIWSVIRHGTRTPGETTASLMRSRLFVVRDLILKHNKDHLRHSDFAAWKPHFELDGDKRLTLEGESEMMALAKRMRSRFPTLLAEPWNNASYFFRFTDTSRTRASANHFTRGLFGDADAKNVWYPSPSKKDPILRFYKLCRKWEIEVKKNPQTLAEVRSFLRGDLFEVIVANVTKRFNLLDATLNAEDIQLMYTTCCFETAWERRKVSPWCHVFTEEEFEILEYAEDLEYFWIDGYGHDLTTKMGCVMLNDVFSHLRSENDRKATFYFTHSGTILKFLAHLQLYKDVTSLRHDNFPLHARRLWRTSRIDVFGSNIAFVLFNCTDGEHVLTLHQEKPIILPGCPIGRHLCSLSHVERLYEESRVNCDFHKMCHDGVDSVDESLLTFIVNKFWSAYESLKSYYFG